MRVKERLCIMLSANFGSHSVSQKDYHAFIPKISQTRDHCGLGEAQTDILEMLKIEQTGTGTTDWFLSFHCVKILSWRPTKPRY